MGGGADEEEIRNWKGLSLDVTDQFRSSFLQFFFFLD